ncbi:MAG: type II CAAX prenyl endopeptidase Rce1 family protein [Streptococcus sp.]
MGLLIVVVAPLGEEIICRAVIPRLIFKGYEKIDCIWLGLLFLPIYIHQVILVPGSSMGACPSS